MLTLKLRLSVLLLMTSRAVSLGIATTSPSLSSSTLRRARWGLLAPPSRCRPEGRRGIGSQGGVGGFSMRNPSRHTPQARVVLCRGAGAHENPHMALAAAHGCRLVWRVRRQGDELRC
jgi:hypothetical protein